MTQLRRVIQILALAAASATGKSSERVMMCDADCLVRASPASVTVGLASRDGPVGDPGFFGWETKPNIQHLADSEPLRQLK